VQAANYARGIQNTQVPAFLNNLLSGQNGTLATGGSGLSTPLSLGTLAGNLGANGRMPAVGAVGGGTWDPGSQVFQPAGQGPGSASMSVPGVIGSPGAGQGYTALGTAGTAYNQNGGGTAATNSTAGMSGTPGSQADMTQALGQASKVAQAGGSALGPQAWESLSPDEQQMFGSMVGAVGGSMPTFLQQYQQSRIGQGAAQAA
jgi:hypothetical protein